MNACSGIGTVKPTRKEINHNNPQTHGFCCHKIFPMNTTAKSNKEEIKIQKTMKISILTSLAPLSLLIMTLHSGHAFMTPSPNRVLRPTYSRDHYVRILLSPTEDDDLKLDDIGRMREEVDFRQIDQEITTSTRFGSVEKIGGSAVYDPTIKSSEVINEE